MAQVSINVSTQFESTIDAQKMEGPEDGCMMIDMQTNISCLGESMVYCRDRLYIHGTPADIRVLIDAMLAALPAEVKAEAVEAA